MWVRWGAWRFGIGTTDCFQFLGITKDVRVKIPESVKDRDQRQSRRPNVTAKDFILAILALDYVRSGQALAKSHGVRG